MLNFTPDASLLTGLTQNPMQQVENNQWLHQAVVPAYRELQRAAASDGIQIRLVSGWRSFQRQATIWQAKCDGRRPVYNLAQQPVTIADLSGVAKLEAIMLYSALPGASRHHWGTDCDIYDAAAVPADYQVQLTAAEYAENGPFYRLNNWLQLHMASYGFFRPYARYQGGIAAEPWHLSYRPLAESCLQAFSSAVLKQVLLTHPIAEQQQVLAVLPTLFSKFVTNICKEQA
jgi:LAS superfamily LD-carboxypeptidase LdcB